MEQNLSNKIICYVCGKTLSSKQANFRRHLKDQHGIIESVKYSVKCEEPSCDYMCSKVGELRTHLQSVHKLDQQVEELHFTNFEDFKTWKHSEEVRTTSRWVIHGRNIPNTTQYFCNRSGNKRTIGTEERKRMLKAQGSCKINATCTSYMSVKDIDGSLQVMYYKSHYGHEVKLEHVRLDQGDKNLIAAQLIQGVSSTKILDKIRESVGEDFERIHLVNKKDIRNIAQTYKIIDGAIRDQNDAVSVDMWVKNSSHIILYKKQGEIDTANVFNKEDFLLAFMTTAQKELLLKFGNEGIICMDATHGTNPYDFKLITILTVDDFEEGFPVAFLFSNREDYTTLKYFLTAVKDRAGDVAAKMFMSDDAEQYFAAWSSIMSSNHTKKLLCAWHIDKSWRNKISIIKNKEKREQVYKMLCVLRQEVEEIQFEELLTSFTAFLGSDEELGAFANYFAQHYASRSKVWATAYRVGSGINTNMYLESMHKTIKYIYLDGKVCRRLDKTINALEKFVRDKQFERVLKLTKGKNKGKHYNSEKRHARAIEDDKMIVAEEDENRWSVSHSDDDNIYDVVRNILPEHICQINCSACDACTHMYSCTCNDYIIKGNICKHVHKVCIIINSKETAPLIHSEFDKENANGAELQMHLDTLRNPRGNNVSKLKEGILNKVEKLKSELFQIQNNVEGIEDFDLLTTITKQLSCIDLTGTLNVTSGIHESVPSLALQSVAPANSNIVVQDRFISTKKKIIAKPKLSKPTPDEKLNIKDILQNRT